MRYRTLVLVVAIALVAAFVALNLEEFTRPSVLSLGLTTVQAPLGLVMLVLLVATTLVFLAATVWTQSANLLENRKYARELHTQRELADKAEASRFTELRQHLETSAAAEKEREAVLARALLDQLAVQQRVFMARFDQSDHTVAAHLGQLEDRFDHGFTAPQRQAQAKNTAELGPGPHQ